MYKGFVWCISVIEILVGIHVANCNPSYLWTVLQQSKHVKQIVRTNVSMFYLGQLKSAPTHGALKGSIQ